MKNTISHITDHKKELRSKLLEQRRNLSERLLSHISRRIYVRLIEFELFTRASNIHIYLPITENREVDTWDIIETAEQMGKEIVVPVMKPGSKYLSHYQIKPGETKLKPNDLGILEPCEEEEYPNPDFDLVIVPMVGGDHYCNRLGYGRGYYDRFLKTQSDAITIGVMPDECLVPNIPTEEHDIPLNCIVTETTICMRGNFG